MHTNDCRCIIDAKISWRRQSRVAAVTLASRMLRLRESSASFNPDRGRWSVQRCGVVVGERELSGPVLSSSACRACRPRRRCRSERRTHTWRRCTGGSQTWSGGWRTRRKPCGSRRKASSAKMSNWELPRKKSRRPRTSRGNNIFTSFKGMVHPKLWSFCH